MQAVLCRPVYSKNFLKENIRQLRITQFRLQNKNASSVRAFSRTASCSKPDRPRRNNSKTPTPRKRALTASLQGILNRSCSGSGRKYRPRYQRYHLGDHQKAEPDNSLQYTIPLKLSRKKQSTSPKKRHLPRRNPTNAKIGQLSKQISLLHYKMNNVPAGATFPTNAWNAVSKRSSNMFAHKTLQMKGNRKSKMLQRKLKNLTKFWQNGADNITKSDATDSDENDEKSCESHYTTSTSSTFDATAKDAQRVITADPGATEVIHLSNNSLTPEMEIENCSSIANDNSVNCSKRDVGVETMGQKPLDASSHEVLNVSCPNTKDDTFRGLSSEEQHEFGQQLTELDYHHGYVPPLNLKRKKIFNSFNKAQSNRRNFITENIKQLREMQIRLIEKRSRKTSARKLQSRNKKAGSSILSQVPMSQTSQKHYNRVNKTPRRKVKNKITYQQKTYLHKITKSNINKAGEHKNENLDQSSSTTSLTSVHESGCTTASGETSRNSAEPNNDKEIYHLSLSNDKENLLSPDGFESPNSIKNHIDGKVMKQNALAPDSQDVVNASSVHQRKICTESMTVKMTAKAMAAREKVLAPSPPNPMRAPPSYQKGVLPRYLVSRHEEQQKKECIRQFTDPDCPPGYVRLPDMERRETLSILRKYYGDLIEAMNMLPVQATAAKIQQKKMDIEKQLDKLQAAIKVFSKPKVFMKVGS